MRPKPKVIQKKAQRKSKPTNKKENTRKDPEVKSFGVVHCVKGAVKKAETKKAEIHIKQ